MEVVVSLVIMSLVLVGLTNLFITGKRYIKHSRLRMTGGEIGKLFVDDFQRHVRQRESAPGNNDGWDQTANWLYIPPPPIDSWAWTAAIPTDVYTPSYSVSRVFDPSSGADLGLRRVTVDLEWNED